MRWSLLAPLLGILALAAGSAAVLLRGVPDREAEAAPQAPPRPPAPEPPGLAAPATSPVPAGRRVAVPTRVPRPPPRDPREAGRVTRKRVREALRAPSVEARLNRCLAVGGLGGGPGASPTPRGAPATLLLDVETHRGGLTVVDARVERWGGASAGAVACAREALRGLAIAGAPVEGADRLLRVPVQLNPRLATPRAAR